MSPTITIRRCPSCRQPYDAAASTCSHCGLVFASVNATPPSAAPAVGPTLALQRFAPPPPPNDALQPGQHLNHGRFTLLRALSQGGMGELYLASDHNAFERSVVLKTLLADPNARPSEQLAAQLHFAEEARTLASLCYPTIPQIFAYFQEGAQQWIVMEYIEGRDLSQGLSHSAAPGQRVKGKPYAIADVLRWGVDLCKILVYLSSRQPPVVHQDIKPANLILHEHSGDLYLVDFGAARTKQVAQPGGGKTSIFGTHGYAAPEQYQGQSEPRSDVYALAATLYHLATDDDPAVHPFVFPRLKYMGYLGMLLGKALDPNVAERPTASEFYAQLRALMAPETTRTLHTPDGMLLERDIDLASWCEARWQDAELWLSTSLPDDVQLLWLRPGLAEKLRHCRDQHQGNLAAGLDASLALLDPQGYRIAPPLLTINPPVLDIGSVVVDGGQMAHGSFTLANQGRRYLYLELYSTKWVELSAQKIELKPGQSMQIALRINRYAPLRKSQLWLIEVRQAELTLLRYEVRGTPVWNGRRGYSAQEMRDGLIVVAWIWGFLMVLACAIWALSALIN